MIGNTAGQKDNAHITHNVVSKNGRYRLNKYSTFVGESRRFHISSTLLRLRLCINLIHSTVFYLVGE
jgi:hypothetical protein